MDQPKDFLNKILNLVIYFFVFLIPLFFLPTTADFYDFNKNYLLWTAVVSGFLLWGVKIVLEKKVEIKTSPFLLPLFLWVLAEVLSIVFSSPNKIEALLLPNGLGTIIGLFLFYFLILNLVEKQEKIFWVLTASATILALITLWQFFGVGETLVSAQSSFAFIRAKNWTPSGNLLATIAFLIVLIPSLIKNLTGGSFKTAVCGLLIFLFLVASSLSIYQILPGKPTAINLLPYRTAWAIAVEVFKQKPLWGIGPVNFISAFTRFRNIDFNQSQLWNLRFGLSSNFLLQLWTELGLVGLLSFVFLLLKLAKHLKSSKKISNFAGLIAATLLLLFLPQSFVLLFIFFVLLAVFFLPTLKFSLKLPSGFFWIPLGVILLLFSPVVWFATRAYRAEVYFKKSLDALGKNDGLGTYNNQIKAIRLNPRRTDFHLAHSQINFALANSIASNPPSGQLTDQDRTNINQLIQQAINEGKAAVSLNPNNAIVWENLAQLYRQLINFAQGADQWAIVAYQEAIKSDPLNPRLRLDLGGLYYALGNYSEAQNIFRISVDLKPDYANAWYNLAAAYREDQKYPQAYQAMQQTLALVPADSPDWEKAKKELDELAKKLPTPTPTPASQPTSTTKEESLTPPQPLPSPVIKPPLELPEEAKPEVSPAVSPSPTPQ